MNRSRRTVTLMLVLLEILALIIGQFCFQRAAHSVAHLSLSLSPEALGVWWQLLILPWFWGALLIYIGATAIWVMILQRVSLTLAYPMLSSVFVLVPLLSYLNRGVWPSGHFLVGLVLVTASIAVIGGGIKNRTQTDPRKS